MPTLTKAQKAEKQEAIERLRRELQPGATVFTTMRHVSSSGMTRHISVLISSVGDDGAEIKDITYLVGRILDYRRHDDGGLVVSGCGMDMGGSLIHNLGYELFPDGFECIGERCPSNDHSNGDRDYSQHLHRSGAYALRHRWM